MTICPKCNKQLKDGAGFCGTCGSASIEVCVCKNCGQQTAFGAAFCRNCGAPLEKSTPAPAAVPPVSTDAPASSTSAVPTHPRPPIHRERKAPPKKALILGGTIGGGILLIALLVLVISLAFNRKSGKSFVLYAKDSELFYSDFSKGDPMQVSDRFISDRDYSNERLASRAYNLGMVTTLTKDGKLLFFPSKIGAYEDTFTLYCRYMNKPKQDPVKIDSDISMYAVSEKGDLVTYLKGNARNGATLYQHDLEDKEKIASDVVEFYVSRDGKQIVYLNDDNSLYTKRSGKDKEKLSSNVTCLYYVSEDCKTMCYARDDMLYLVRDGKDPEKVASNVKDVIAVYASGEIYYLKSESEEVNLLDYIEDDKLESDANMSRPEEPDYPYYWDYETDEEYQAAKSKYDADYQAYSDAMDAYYAKNDRDYLRDELRNYTMTQTRYTLCYYDGTEEVKITDAFISNGYSSYAAAKDVPVLIYKSYSQSADSKINLSDLSYAYEAYDKIQDMLFSSSEMYVACGKEATLVSQNTASSFAISQNGETIYFIDDIHEEKNYGDLYQIRISKGKVQDSTLYDTDVAPGMYYFVSNDKFLYLKDADDYEGELFLNKESICDDVNFLYVFWDDASGKAYYITDWNSTHSYGTLNVYKNGKSTKIADDVYDFQVTFNGDVVYLYDYSNRSYRGDLYIYRSNKPVKLDEDVIAIIPAYYTDYHFCYGF